MHLPLPPVKPGRDERLSATNERGAPLMPLMLLGGDRAPDSFTLISFQSDQADSGLEKPAIVVSVRCSFKDSLIVWSNIIIPLFFGSSQKRYEVCAAGAAW